MGPEREKFQEQPEIPVKVWEWLERVRAHLEEISGAGAVRLKPRGPVESGRRDEGSA